MGGVVSQVSLHISKVLEVRLKFLLKAKEARNPQKILICLILSVNVRSAKSKNGHFNLYLKLTVNLTGHFVVTSLNDDFAGSNFLPGIFFLRIKFKSKLI